MGEQLQGVFNKQEDDSGVNHLWKGEMWPAQLGLIHARHVQNTRGAGANNWSSCQWATVISFDILIVSQSKSNFGNIAVSPGTCPSQLPSVRGFAGPWCCSCSVTEGPCLLDTCPARRASPREIGPDCCHFRSLWRFGSGVQANADNCHISKLLEFVGPPA